MFVIGAESVVYLLLVVAPIAGVGALCWALYFEEYLIV